MAGESNSLDHFALHAYVKPSEIVRLEPYGRVSFDHIYRSRIDGARYAVAGQYDLATHSDRFIVWDLFIVKKDPASAALTMPRPKIIHTDLDAALLASILLYEGR